MLCRLKASLKTCRLASRVSEHGLLGIVGSQDLLLLEITTGRPGMLHPGIIAELPRSEERRVGKEWRTGRAKHFYKKISFRQFSADPHRAQQPPAAVVTRWLERRQPLHLQTR